MSHNKIPHDFYRDIIDRIHLCEICIHGNPTTRKHDHQWFGIELVTLAFYKRGAEENALFCNEGAGNLLFNEGKYEEALSYFLNEKSLTARGCFQMGEMYENGWGTDINLYQAAICYKKARHGMLETPVGTQANAKVCSAKFCGVILKPSEDPDYRKAFEGVCHYSDEFIDKTMLYDFYKVDEQVKDFIVISKKILQQKVNSAKDDDTL